MGTDLHVTVYVIFVLLFLFLSRDKVSINCQSIQSQIFFKYWGCIQGKNFQMFRCSVVVKGDSCYMYMSNQSIVNDSKTFVYILKPIFILNFSHTFRILFQMHLM